MSMPRSLFHVNSFRVIVCHWGNQVHLRIDTFEAEGIDRAEPQVTQA